MRNLLLNRLKAATLLLAAAILSACATGPDYQQPQVAEPTIHVAPHIGVQQQQTEWWQRFDDPVLDALVELTLQHNPSLDVARANVNAAYAIFTDIDNDDRPSGSLNADYSVQDQVSPGVSDERRTTRSYRTGADIAWNLDLFGKLKRAAEAAQADAEASYFAWRDLQISLVAQVVQTYGQLKGTRAQIDVALRNIETLNQTRSVIENRVDVGFASELDLHRIDARRFGVEASIPELQADFERFKNTLIALAGGQQKTHQFTLNQVNGQLPDLDAPLAIGDPTSLLRRRADLRAAERRVAAATADIGVATADLYPDLSLTGFLGFLSGSSSLALNNESRAWSVAPSLSWSAFDRGSVKAQIDVANARQQAALADFQQQVLSAIEEAQSALSEYAETQRQRHLLQAQTQASSAALELAQLQYDAGAIDLLDLLDTERTLLAAKDNLVQAKTRTFVVIADIYRAFGGGLQADTDIEGPLLADTPPKGE